ncbi:hypothetical protein [Roseimaritima sediminicola]|uniref:hypothetical protein n=1 Tax=Roseimaritima sediminicola TaxID=2662066 RepID=UPI001F3EDF10|nr:hypothetical protein [Roseimaritima sediminicola]
MNKPSSPPLNPQTDESSKMGEYGEVAREKLSAAAQSAAEQATAAARQCSTHFVAEPAQDLYTRLRDYAKQKPDVAAAWCFGLGVLIGFKLRR